MSEEPVIEQDGFIHFEGKTYCPRRRESGFGLHHRADVGDTWKEREGDGARCEWCGSISPEAFFAAVDAGQEIGPTDKSYKVYVGSRGKFYFQHFSKEHVDRFIALYNARDAETGKRPMNIGFPNHFYVLPFFMKLRKPGE